MANPTQLANKARTTLMAALQALQTDDAPAALMNIAEPIADTMGILHRIEKSGSADADECSQALDNIRTALDELQNVVEAHPAVDAAMESVAGSLSKLFALNKSVRPSTPPQGPAAAAPAAPPAPTVPRVPTAASGPSGTVSIQPDDAVAVRRELEEARTQTARINVASAPDLSELKATLPIDNKIEPVRVPIPTKEPVHRSAAVGRPQATALQGGREAQQAIAQADAAAQQRPVSRVPGMTDAPLPPSGAHQIDVELGAHSGSNFYKGLSGNDVIDHGGIFVATYKIPKIGDPVLLRILLPGDLEFVSDGVVTWTRETRSGESDPGFGAKFTRITEEGRQLVYRYVRNREPMFYDDL